MSAETSKAADRRRVQWAFTNRIFKGRGIDIGCGADLLQPEHGFPLIESCEPFDLEHGNAQFIHQYKEEGSYDFVHSSQCLEHMVDAYEALKNWFKLVKVGGYLVATFPDEDLYEQGTFPSRWNHDHKWTFSINKKKSWSYRHIDVLDMLASLENCKIIRVDLIDTNYNYALNNVDQTRGDAEAFIEIVLQKI
jgi:SAM-dependent methyltransferase